MKLLYRTAEWHALAKLRMHSDSTLVLLEELTIEFGKLIRQFRDLSCTQFQTVELPKETAARNRQQAKRQVAAPCTTPISAPSVTTNYGPTLSFTTPAATASTNHFQGQAQASRPRTKSKILNLLTVKLHFLGDYVRHIRLFGTTDSYSTQLICKPYCNIQAYADRYIVQNREKLLIDL